MKRALIVAAVFSVGVLAVSYATAQGSRQEMNSCLAEMVQRRIQSQQPVQLSAETITLAGDTLRLSGRAWIRFNDTSIRSDEAVFNQATKRLELVGSVNTFLGSASDCAAVPRLEFR
jgi:lipopolysaccharide assembly outer membrane protein LptD (OstA)